MGGRWQDGREQGKETGPGGEEEPRRVLRGGHVSQTTWLAWPQRAAPGATEGLLSPFWPMPRPMRNSVGLPQSRSYEKPRSPFFWEPKPEATYRVPGVPHDRASPPAGAAPQSPRIWGGGVGRSQLQGSRSGAMTTGHPRDDPLRSASPSRPSSPWVGERARPLYAGENQCRANVRFPGGGSGVGSAS